MIKSILKQTRKKDEVVDITETVQKLIDRLDKEHGTVTIFVAHTTCSITTADLDPGTDLDFLEAVRKIIPDIKYRHEHDPQHTPDHILASIIGSSVTVPYENKKLILGAWQRIVLVEFNGARVRKIIVSA